MPSTGCSMPCPGGGAAQPASQPETGELLDG
jgi:hypothetical protein